MFLLILLFCTRSSVLESSLHSNMFLLIHYNVQSCYLRIELFTFQYVSINTISALLVTLERIHFTFQYVSINTYSLVLLASDYRTLHSNMFLLIQSMRAVNQLMWPNFTFQYVSINTDRCRWTRRVFFSLHSNMFLLIPDS